MIPDPATLRKSGSSEPGCFGSSREGGAMRDIQRTKRAVKALQQSANGTPAQKLKALAKGYTMKASLLFVMAASMIFGTAVNAQTNPYPNDPARPHNRLPLPPPPSATRRTIPP